MGEGELVLILVVGDAMIDRYWYGDVTRISPDAPVPVVSVKEHEDRAGAAANVCVNIKAMGGEVKGLYSPSFKKNPVVKLRVVSKSHHVVRIDFDHPQDPISIADFERELKDCSILVVSDYGKGSLKYIEDMIAIAKSNHVRVLVDPKGYRYAKYEGADVLKPNLDELKVIIGGWESDDELEYKINALRARASIGSVLLTQGSGGMTLFNGHRMHIDAVAREIVDVSGAGEAAISALAACISDDMDLQEAAVFANKAAGLACGRFGTTVLTKSEVFC